MRKINIILILLLTSASMAFSQPKKKIAYSSWSAQSDSYQIFTMDEDGGDKKQITHMAYGCFHPRWSNDGTKLVYDTEEQKIYVISGLDTNIQSDPVYIFDGTNPSFMADDESVIFNSDYDGSVNIYVYEPMENDAYPLTIFNYANQQVLSDDGTKLVYSAFFEGSKSIMITDLTDTTDDNTQIISVNKNANMLPDISSDGQMFVYTGFNNQLNGTIYIFRNGTETALSKGITSASLPRFSPNDQLIAFVSIHNNSVKLNVMNLDGSGRTTLKTKGGEISRYTWLDNERIVYDAENGTDYIIGIVNINTGESTLLTEEGAMHPDVQNL